MQERIEKRTPTEKFFNTFMFPQLQVLLFLFVVLSLWPASASMSFATGKQTNSEISPVQIAPPPSPEVPSLEIQSPGVRFVASSLVGEFVSGG